MTEEDLVSHSPCRSMVLRIAAVYLAVVSVEAASLTPYHLETEARPDPVGIDVVQPRLSWKLQSGVRGDRQVGYEVLVASTEERLAAGDGDLWRSGRVNSEETTWIPYGGVPLRSFQRCWWSVRVWGASGQVSGWSRPAQWTMAIVNEKDRSGQWIGYPVALIQSGPLPIFRKEFGLNRPLRRALALVSGVGFHELRINGRKVGNSVLEPAWSNYRSTVFYEMFDVTPNLRQGTNAIGVLLGNGFYNVAGGRYTKFTGSFGQPKLYLQLHLEFADGGVEDIASDTSWRTRYGPLTFSCIYGGEDFDARLEPEGWDQAGFEDSGWERAGRVAALTDALHAQSSPPIRIQQTFAPVRITNPKPGVFVYDLGQNFAGWPRIEVSGSRGAQVRLTPGELLNASGLVSQVTSGGPTYFAYTLRGSGREAWSPRFSYTGFRYVQVEGAAPDNMPAAGVPVLHQLEGQFLHLDAARVGRFHCSKEIFNRIHALIDAAARSNLQHSLTDCPHREKLGWLEVPHLMGPSLLYNWDLRAWLPKVSRDIREAQTVDGLFPDIAPEYPVLWGGFRDSPEWGSAGVMLPSMAWEWYGDRDSLARSYPAMKRYMEYLEARSKDGLLSYGLGDWFDIGPAAPGRSQLTPLGLTASAIWWADLNRLAEAARLLDLPEDAKAFSARQTRVYEAFQKAFYRPGQLSYATGSQTALAVPLALGMAPDSARTSLVGALVDDIRRRGNHTSAGDIGYHYVVQALLAAGRSDVLFDLASQTEAPSYSAQLAAGATSLTEAWDGNPGISQNHLMLGHIEEWFYAGIGGIRPDLRIPGLRRIRIQPEPVGDLSAAETSWETIRGSVSVRWQIDGAVFRMDVVVPPGVTAVLSLPAPRKEQVRENGVAAAAAPGVRFLAEEEERTAFEIGSGSYEFEVQEFRR